MVWRNTYPSLPKAKHPALIESLIATLEQLLYTEGGDATIFVSEADKELLRRMMQAEFDGNCDFGIGFNGLYIAFHFAAATIKDVAARGLIKSPPAPEVFRGKKTDPAPYPGG